MNLNGSISRRVLRSKVENRSNPSSTRSSSRRAVRGVPGEHQPNVLHGRPRHHVVEVDEREAPAGLVDEVAPVAVAVDAREPDAVEERRDLRDRAPSDAVEVVPAVRVHELIAEQLVHERGRQARGLTDHTVRRDACGAYRVASADEGPQAEQIVVGFRLEGSAAGSRKHGEEESRCRGIDIGSTISRATVRRAAIRAISGDLDLLERTAVGTWQGSDHRDFRIGEVTEEPMLVEDGRPAPSAGPVELCDERLPVLPAHAVHTVDVARVRLDRAVEHDRRTRVRPRAPRHRGRALRRIRRSGRPSPGPSCAPRGQVRALGPGSRFERGEDPHCFLGAPAAHADRRFEAGAHDGPLGPAEQQAPQVGGQLNAVHACRFAAGHAGDRRGDRRGDAAGPARGPARDAAVRDAASGRCHSSRIMGLGRTGVNAEALACRGAGAGGRNPLRWRK